MKTVTESKNFNSKLWIRIISVVLCVVTIGVACLGTALFVSNDNISVLRRDINDINEELETLTAKNKSSELEIDSLQNAQMLSDKKLESLTTDLAAANGALTQSKTEQKALENSLAALANRLSALEKTNQSAQGEIDQLKSDIDNAEEEIADLKEQIADFKDQISDLKEQIKESDDKIRIYIDQGHNPAPYHNTGASGNGLHEQDVTFLIGCLLSDLLKSDGRFAVQLSRPNKSVVLGTDNSSSLAARVEGAVAFEADYFISLHTNSFTQDTANGIEVYVAEESSESYSFGESLLNGLIESTNLRDRGMKLNPDLFVLKSSTMPAALLEMGFISNSTDAELLSEHPELFAQGIYNGILDYFGLLPNTSI